MASWKRSRQFRSIRRSSPTPRRSRIPPPPNLVRFTLRSAVREAHFAEGNSPVRAHIVLNEFSSSDGKVRRVLNLGTAERDNIVDGKLVIQDASGKHLATREIHFRGNVGLNADEQP